VSISTYFFGSILHVQISSHVILTYTQRIRAHTWVFPESGTSIINSSTGLMIFRDGLQGWQILLLQLALLPSHPPYGTRNV
jgi:hypothetical protein